MHLVVCFFCFFGACQCFVKSESPNLHRHQKNKKNQTTRCTKPAQAPKKPKKLKFPGTMGPLLSSCWIFCFFWFFGACRCLVHLVVCFFCFFGACQCFCISHVKIMMKKVCFTRGFRPSKCIKHRYLQCFIIIFNENSLPHGVPPSCRTGGVV